MPGYKLHYFNARGRAETSRLVLAVAGVPYEDIRYEFSEWPEVQKKMPYRCMPALEVEGQKGILSQSCTIARYLAREHGLGGTSNHEQAVVDEVLSVVEDLIAAGSSFLYEKDETIKAEKKKKFLEETVPKIFSRLDERADGEYFTWQLTVADIMLFSFQEGKDFLDFSLYPKLKKIVENVGANPRVKEWIAKRPESSF